VNTDQIVVPVPRTRIGVYGDDSTRYDRPPLPAISADGVRHYANIAVARVPGYRPLHMDLYVPPAATADRPWPLVAWIHGGAFREGSRTSLPDTLEPVGFHEHLLARGYAVAEIDYRLSREAVFPAQLHDVRAAIAWLRTFAGELHLDPDRFAAWGESAGGMLAALAGLGDRLDVARVQAVVDWYGPSDCMDETRSDPDDPGVWLLGGTASQKPEPAFWASPVRQVHDQAPPFLLMHGTADSTIPYAESENLAVALRAVGVRADLVPVEGAGHVFRGVTDMLTLVQRSLDFLDDTLARG
jgi:acetyl esterase/lipase